MIKKFLLLFIGLSIVSVILLFIGLLIVNENGNDEFLSTSQINAERVIDFYLDENVVNLMRLNKAHAYWTQGNEYLNSEDSNNLDSSISKFLYEGEFDVDFVYISNEDETFTQSYGDISFDITKFNLYSRVLDDNLEVDGIIWDNDIPLIVTATPFANDDISGKNGVLLLGTRIEDNDINELKLLLGESEIENISLHENDVEEVSNKYKVFSKVFTFNYNYISSESDIHFDITFHFAYLIYSQTVGLEQTLGTVVITYIIMVIIISIVLTKSDKLISKFILDVRNIDSFNTPFNRLEKTKSTELNFIAESINSLTDRLGVQFDLLGQKKLEIIKLLSTAIEINDKYTKEHGENVSKISKMIGIKLNISNLDKLETAALLHDVGKVFLPLEILNKPGTLSVSEFEDVKNHPNNAYDLLENISGYEEIRIAIKHHHEKFDGTGYPDKISGTDIPLHSRIIAVADVFDALTTDRAYRKCFAIEKAMEIMKNLSGTHFDPQVLNAFFEIETETKSFSKPSRF